MSEMCKYLKGVSFCVVQLFASLWAQAGGGEARSPGLRSVCWARAMSLRLVLEAGGAGRGFGVVVAE